MVGLGSELIDGKESTEDANREKGPFSLSYLAFSPYLDLGRHKRTVKRPREAEEIGEEDDIVSFMLLLYIWCLFLLLPISFCWFTAPVSPDISTYQLLSPLPEEYHRRKKQ